MSNHKIDARISVKQDEALSEEERVKKQLADQARSDQTVADQHRANIAKFKADLAKQQNDKKQG